MVETTGPTVGGKAGEKLTFLENPVGKLVEKNAKQNKTKGSTQIEKKTWTKCPYLELRGTKAQSMMIAANKKE